jgi:hypothetical protein
MTLPALPLWPTVADLAARLGLAVGTDSDYLEAALETAKSTAVRYGIDVTMGPDTMERWTGVLKLAGYEYATRNSDPVGAGAQRWIRKEAITQIRGASNAIDTDEPPTVTPVGDQ